MKTNRSVSGGRVRAGGHRPERPWQLRIGFWLLLAIAAFYLFTEHRAHLALGLPYLPFLLLVACPLIHVFGHGGHGRHVRHPPNDVKPSPPSEAGSDAIKRKADGTHRHGGSMP